MNYRILQQNDNTQNRLLYSELKPSFIFKVPFIGKLGYRGVPLNTQSTYQVFLSAAESSFLEGTLSSTPLSSVDYYSSIRSLSATYPPFNAYNVLDFGSKLFFDIKFSTVQVNLDSIADKRSFHIYSHRARWLCEISWWWLYW